jgi:hypothetical protein
LIRSIFIGFLILTTLTANDAGVQIAAGTSGTAAALRDIINAASAYAEKTAGTSGEGSLISSCKGLKSVNSHLLSLNDGSEVYTAVSSSEGDIGLVCFGGIYECGSSRVDKGMYCCRSGLSPPYGYMCPNSIVFQKSANV